MEQRTVPNGKADAKNPLNHAALNKKGVESLIRAGAMDSLPGNRAQKLHVYEKAMDGASRQLKSTVSGQISLFGLMDDDLAAPPPMPDIREFDHFTRLQMEKETTGVYISGHPLDAYIDQLSKLRVSSQTLAELTEAPDGGMSWDQKTVRMGGLVAEKKLKCTKSGGMMAFIQLEDMYGVTEVLVFPRVYDRESATLEQDAAVVMTGRLSVREDEAPKLLMDRVAPLKDIDKLSSGPLRDYAPPQGDMPGRQRSPYAPRGRKLYLKLTAETREAALSILAQTPGNICVMLYMADEKKTYQAPRDYWVDEGYDFGALANLIGPDGIVLK